MTTGAHANVFKSCQSELEMYCADVTPGHGRVLSCLYAHEDKVSETCDVTISETADIIDAMFEQLRYAKQQCGDDVARLCAEVGAGSGQILSCLQDNEDDLSHDCAELIHNVGLPRN